MTDTTLRSEKTFEYFLNEAAAEKGAVSYRWYSYHEKSQSLKNEIVNEAAKRFGEYMYAEGMKAGIVSHCYFVADDRKGSLLTTCINCDEEKWKHKH